MELFIQIGGLIVMPIILLISGYLIKKHPPRKPNIWYGYRTPRSMKNDDLWKEGNRYAANLLIYLSTFLVFVNILLSAFYQAEIFEDENSIITLSGIIVITITTILFPITEYHLYKYEKKNKQED